MPDLDGKGPRKRSQKPSVTFGGSLRGLNRKKKTKTIKAPTKIGVTVRSEKKDGKNLRITRIKKR